MTLTLLNKRERAVSMISEPPRSFGRTLRLRSVWACAKLCLVCREWAVRMHTACRRRQRKVRLQAPARDCDSRRYQRGWLDVALLRACRIVV